MQDHMIPDLTERQYPADPAEAWMREADAVDAEIRESDVCQDCAQQIRDVISDVLYKHPGMDAHDGVLLLRGVLATLEEV